MVKSKNHFIKDEKILTILLLAISFSAYSQENSSEEVFTRVDKPPEFPGGTKKLFRFLSKEIKYPQKAALDKTEGTIYVSFIVTKGGKIKDIQIVKGETMELNDETIRVIGKMPDWIPGEKDGK